MPNKVEDTQKFNTTRLALVACLACYLILLLSTYVTLKVAIFGAIFAYLLNPLYVYLKKHFPKYAALIVVCGVYLLFLIPLIFPLLMKKEILFYLELMTDFSREALLDGEKNIYQVCNIAPDLIRGDCELIIRSLPQKLALLTGNWLRYMLDAVDSITKTFFILLLIPPFAIYLLNNIGQIKELLRLLLSSDRFAQCASYARRANSILYSFIYAHCVFAVIYFVYFFTTLHLIGLRGAFLLALAAALLTFIPALGQFASIVLIIGSVIITYGFSAILWKVVIILSIMQVVDVVYLTPKILGESVGINPILTVMIIIVASSYGGVIVTLLSLPIASLIHHILLDLTRNIQALRGRNII